MNIWNIIFYITLTNNVSFIMHTYVGYTIDDCYEKSIKCTNNTLKYIREYLNIN